MNLQVQKVVDELIALRKKNGLSQRALARIMGVQSSTVNHFEHDPKEDPRLSVLFRYAAALGAHIRLEVQTNGDEVQLRDPNSTRQASEGAPGI